MIEIISERFYQHIIGGCVYSLRDSNKWREETVVKNWKSENCIIVLIGKKNKGVVLPEFAEQHLLFLTILSLHLDHND